MPRRCVTKVVTHLLQPLQMRQRKPWYFRLAASWINSGMRGGYRWLNWLRRQGLLDACAPFRMGDKEILLPLDTIGATDEIGAEAVECVHHIRDVHVTWLNLLGLDDNKLTYYHAGRHKQLSQFGGKVIQELIA